MIEKLKNGNTLITLGEGTTYIGNVGATDDEKPFGIYFSDKPEQSDKAVIINLPNQKAIASYIMAITQYIEAHTEDDDYTLKNSIARMKADLEPLLQFEEDKK
ncbi:hypothetical protein [Terribacillus saccharophilus]|uniref:hypothetical protein n=1 Tax=Terribacillus saccharophilus TaxID=361277 RepID=UPI000BA5C0F7|nr:hypothetical protein [Terribacillus saccharophilus]PAF19728.1 hypothetical protein CHH51_01310 [Terribacillus saccharophilus]